MPRDVHFPDGPHWPPSAREVRAREAWARQRLAIERTVFRHGWRGGKGQEGFSFERTALAVLGRTLRRVGLYRRGHRNANQPVVVRQRLRLRGLPEAFEGFRILHLSDLHLDRTPRLERKIVAAWAGRPADLGVITGDFRDHVRTSTDRIARRLAELLRALPCRHGWLGVLGNHDSARMVAPVESAGLRLLINETVRLRHGPASIRIVGLDDVHAFETTAASAALDELVGDDTFTLALVHSAEYYDHAARAGAGLYLCGHTHGGQIALPGGIPILRELKRGRSFYGGRWHYRGMIGRTHIGTGTSGLPVRFNTRSEVALLELTRRAGSVGLG